MNDSPSLATVPDEELLKQLQHLVRSSRRTEAELVAHVGEVDARRLYAREACPSMFVYCTRVLHLSEHESYVRITAARAARRYPALASMIADGRLHLSGIAKLAPHLTPDNAADLLQRATHRSKREIVAMLAALFPQPDAPACIRRLPTPRGVLGPDRVGPSSATAFQAGTSVATASAGGASAWSTAGAPTTSGGPKESSSPGVLNPPAERTAQDNAATDERAPAPVGKGRGAWPSPASPTATIEPTAAARYRVQFTAGAELREKLERLRALMRSSVPDGDLATVIEAAVTEKLERLEARRFGITQRPRKSLAETDSSPASRYVPAPVRRAVHERDGGRCRYIDQHGRRCDARDHLEYHHGRPYAVSGPHSVDNVSLLCSTHNRMMAEIDFGLPAGAAGGVDGRRGRLRQPPPGSPRAREAARDRPGSVLAREAARDRPGSAASGRAAGP